MDRQRKLWVIVLAAMIAMASCARRGDALTTDVAPGPVFVSDNPQSIYAADLSDSWNRIFRALFTRTVNARVSDAFPEGAPFVSFRMDMGSSSLRLSKAKLSRTELGDRAIEPLYPTFFSAKGIIEVLSDPLYSELTSALQQAIDEKKTRSPIERALMQADVWAAYDIIYGDEFNPTTVSPGRKTKLLDLLRQFIRKLVLTSDEIKSLKNNYLRAVSGNDLRAVSRNDLRVVSGSRLPDLFAAESGWLEIELGPHRLHDDAARFRRAARVFVKPRTRPSDPGRYLETLKFNQNVD